MGVIQKMRKRIIYSGILLLVLIVTLFMGCLPAPSTSTAVPKAGATATDEAQNKRLDTVESNIAKLSSDVSKIPAQTAGIARTEFDGLANRVTLTETNISRKLEATSLDSVKNDLATVTTKLTTALADITTLKAEIVALKATPQPTPTPTPTPTGNVAVSIYSVSPSMIYTAGEYTIFLEVYNSSSTVKKVFLTGILSPSAASSNVAPTTNCTGTALTYFTEIPSVALSPSSGTGCQLIMITTPQLLIASQAKLLIPIKFNLAYQQGSNPAIWTPTFSATVLP